MARSSNQPDRQLPVEASGLSDSRAKQLPPGSDGERGPTDSKVQASSNPPQPSAEWSTGAPLIPESGALEHQSTTSPKTKPRAKDWPLLRGRVHPQKHLKYWRFQHIIGRDMQLLLEEAMDDLLLKYSFAPAATEHQCSTINDLDLTDDKNRSQSSKHESGAPVLHSTLRNKESAVLTYYGAKTGNRVRERDRQAYERGHAGRHGFVPGIADVPTHIILLGIKESILACDFHVNSLAFCLPRIHKLATEGASPEMDEYLERTFNVQLEAKQNPQMSSDEYLHKLRAAARGGAQPTLPGVGAELVELSARVADEPPVLIADPEPAAVEAWNKVLSALQAKIKIACPLCFGTGMKAVPGKGTGRCECQPINQQAYSTWLEPVLGQRITTDTLVLCAPNSTVRDWIRSHYETALAEAMNEAGLASYRIEWEISK